MNDRWNDSENVDRVIKHVSSELIVYPSVNLKCLDMNARSDPPHARSATLNNRPNTQYPQTSQISTPPTRNDRPYFASEQWVSAARYKRAYWGQAHIERISSVLGTGPNGTAAGKQGLAAILRAVDSRSKRASVVGGARRCERWEDGRGYVSAIACWYRGGPVSLQWRA